LKIGFLNIWQTYQFNLGVIPWDYVTKEYYWRVFFKSTHTPEDDLLLMSIEEALKIEQ
jgi:hypothetical protein